MTPRLSSSNLRSVFFALVCAGAASFVGCGKEDPVPEDGACTVIGCDCESDSDCHPSLTCNLVIGFCSAPTGGGQDGGAADGGADDAGGGADDVGGGGNDAAPDALVSDIGSGEALSAFDQACSDACLTYGRCNDGDDNLCDEFCSSMQVRIDEVGMTDIAEECAAYWEEAASCIADIAQSCNAVGEFFEERTLCVDNILGRPDCFGFDGLDDQDDPPDGSGDEAPDGSGDAP